MTRDCEESSQTFRDGQGHQERTIGSAGHEPKERGERVRVLKPLEWNSQPMRRSKHSTPGHYFLLRRPAPVDFHPV